MSRKILYSPGYGAGWTSWADDRYAKIMIDWPPLIEALEKGEKVGKDHPAVISMIERIKEEFDEEDPYIYLGGLGQLQVATVSGRVRINEYDGDESYEDEGEFSGWL